MAYYLVRYSRGGNNEYVYPAGVAGVAWKSVVYHRSKTVMIGETEDKLTADGNVVIFLTPEEARKRVRECLASYPRARAPSAESRSPRSRGPKSRRQRRG